MDNWKRLVKLGLVVGGLACGSAHAGVKILDFDTDAHGRHISDAQIIDNEYLGSEFGVKIKSCNFRGYASNHEINNAKCNSHDIANRAVAFDTDNNSSKDNDYKTQYTPVNVGGVVGANRPGNILVINEDWISCNATHCSQANDEGSRPNGFVEFLFDDLVDIISLDFFDFDEGARNNRSRISFYEGNTERPLALFPIPVMVNLNESPLMLQALID
ncbi:MAG: hypothetical protein GJ671_07400 [Alteromonadaceae bacterium]|nr:hypothetical protein [Alteromonadaceae bacterium]